jgi:hypothetical protein
MCVDVAAYTGFCLFALGVCIRAIVLDGMWWCKSNNILHTVHTAYVPAPHDRSQHNQANTTCSLKDSCSPDDGHNNARNMLRVY